MPTENADYIGGLDTTLPDNDTDYVYEGDDHLRLLKRTIKRSFGGHPGAVELYIRDTVNTNNYVGNPSPAITGYYNGMLVKLIVSNSNTGDVTLDLNDLGPVPVRPAVGSVYNFNPGNFRAGKVYTLVYIDGSFYVTNSGSHLAGTVNDAVATIRTDGTLAPEPFGLDDISYIKAGVLAPHQDLVLDARSGSTTATLSGSFLLKHSLSSRVRRVAFSTTTFDVTLEWGVDPDPANGRASGIALTTNTWYHVWAIYNSSTGQKAVLLADTYAYSIAVSLLPSGYDYFGLVGAVRTDSKLDALRILYQRDRYVTQAYQYVGTVTNGATSNLSLTNACPGSHRFYLGHVRTWVDVTGSPAVIVFYIPGSASAYDYLRDPSAPLSPDYNTHTFNGTNMDQVVRVYAAPDAGCDVYIGQFIY